MKLVVVADTFLKILPDPVSQFQKTKLLNQVVLLKRGTTLDIYDYHRLNTSVNSKIDDYIFVRLATPQKLTGHQNLCWFVKTAHVEIKNERLQNHSPREGSRHCFSTLDINSSFRRDSFPRKLKYANPMDSFCGLAVSPPVTVRGHYYPFGRIVYNSCAPTNRAQRSPQTTSVLSNFFQAQKIQSPFGLHTDWLIPDRVNEIISFLPANNEKGFQLLVASPLSASRILQGLAHSGFADTVMFQGAKRADYNSPPGTYRSAEISVGDLLQDAAFWIANQRYQNYIDDNIQTLKAELDINEYHLLRIPVLFHPPFRNGRSAVYFPNMVNHVRLEDGSLIVPQPKGPVINGKCAFEIALECTIPSRPVLFAENWHSQYQSHGEVPLWA